MDLKLEIGTIEMVTKFLDQLITIDHSHFGNESWSNESFLSPLPEKFSNSLIMLDENKVIGYAIVSKKENNFHIHRFVISKQLIARGYGKKLLDHLEKKCSYSTLSLKVNKQNIKAIIFYLCQDFKFNQAQNNYYLMLKNGK